MNPPTNNWRKGKFILNQVRIKKMELSYSRPSLDYFIPKQAKLDRKCDSPTNTSVTNIYNNLSKGL